MVDSIFPSYNFWIAMFPLLLSPQMFLVVVEIVAAAGLTAGIFHSLDAQLGASILTKTGIAVGRWTQKHIIRIFQFVRILKSDENRLVFEYDKIRTISQIITFTVVSDIVAVSFVILAIRMEYNDYVADDVFVHIALIVTLAVLWFLYRKTTRICYEHGSEIEFLNNLERAHSARKGASETFPSFGDGDMTPEAILQRLAKLTPPQNLDEEREYLALQDIYVRLRLDSENAIQTILTDAERKFDKRWLESAKANH